MRTEHFFQSGAPVPGHRISGVKKGGVAFFIKLCVIFFLSI